MNDLHGLVEAQFVVVCGIDILLVVLARFVVVVGFVVVVIVGLVIAVVLSMGLQFFDVVQLEGMPFLDDPPHKIQEGRDGLEFHQILSGGWIGIGNESPHPKLAQAFEGVGGCGIGFDELEEFVRQFLLCGHLEQFANAIVIMVVIIVALLVFVFVIVFVIGAIVVSVFVKMHARNIIKMIDLIVVAVVIVTAVAASAPAPTAAIPAIVNVDDAMVGFGRLGSSDGNGNGIGIGSSTSAISAIAHEPKDRSRRSIAALIDFGIGIEIRCCSCSCSCYCCGGHP
jgi:hypothetical protein